MGSVRATLHTALTQPHLFLEEVHKDDDCSEDIVSAYQLMLGQQDSMNVASWYNEYCHFSGLKGGGDGGGEDALVAAEGKGAGKVAKATRRGKQAGGASKRAAKKGGKREEEEEEDIPDEVLIPQLLEHAARFGQAVNDLHFIGVCRPNKRKKENHMQRSYFAPEMMF
eukprot:gene23755-9311_t